MKNDPSDCAPKNQPRGVQIGIVLSGGGSRGAYQIGALKALAPVIEASNDVISVIVGTSMGALNGLVLGASLPSGLSNAVSELESLWRERTFRNTFAGSPSLAFLRALKIAILKYSSPTPAGSRSSIFDPSPLVNRVEETMQKHGGLHLSTRHPGLKTVAVMTTVEGKARRPLLFASSHQQLNQQALQGVTYNISYVESLTAKHGFASAALPSVLPAVDLDVEEGKVTLVDGGICENFPVDPAVRFGAHYVIIIDSSGRIWWLDHYAEAHDTKPTWEVPVAAHTYCLRPPETFVIRNKTALGPLLKNSVSGSTKRFIQALGPTWPIFQLLRRKMGEELAYEVMSYVAVDPDYISATIELGYQETLVQLEKQKGLTFQKDDTSTLVAETAVA